MQYSVVVVRQCKIRDLLGIQKKKLSAGSFKLICSHSCNLFKDSAEILLIFVAYNRCDLVNVESCSEKKIHRVADANILNIANQANSFIGGEETAEI